MSPLEQTTYDGRATEEILRLVRASRRMDYFTREDLVRAAAEIGVPESQVIEAERFVRERQSELDDRAEYRRARWTDIGKGLLIGVPIIILVCFLHVFAFVGQALGAMKGAAKGIGAIFFAKSTRHEVEFQAWRNKRFYMTEYGSDDPSTMLAKYFVKHDTERRSVLMSWLMEVNGIDEHTAYITVARFANSHRGRVVEDPKPVERSMTAALPVQENWIA